MPVPLEPLANLRQRVAAQDLPYSLHWNDPELPGDVTNYRRLTDNHTFKSAVDICINTGSHI